MQTVVVVHRGPGALSILALVFGGIALLFCWIPFVGLLTIPVALLGLFFAALGFILEGLSGRGIGTSFIGRLLCAGTIAMAMMSTGATATAINKAIQETPVTEQPVEPVEKPVQTEGKPKPSDFVLVPDPQQAITPEPVEVVEQPTKKEPSPEYLLAKRNTEAANKLKLAKAILKKGGSTKGALKFLNEIVEKYGDTESVDEAKELIKLNTAIK